MGSEKKDTKKQKKKEYEKKLFELQVQLCQLQEWAKHSGLKAIVLFEGRDAAGKGGVIKRITERVSPRTFRVEALPAPSEYVKTQMFGQRYIERFPSGGEIVLFDRSWYNRAGVERVMGFCTKEELKRFYEHAPIFEKMIVNSGIHLIKYWFEVSQEEQERRFRGRMTDPTKHWKLSPMDMESHRRWYDYSEARDEMLKHTDTDHAPWYIVPSDNKRKARLNCISHLLSVLPYKKIPFKVPALPKRNTKKKYDDQKPLKGRRFIPERF
jgi:polyphosphate kinase 2